MKDLVIVIGSSISTPHSHHSHSHRPATANCRPISASLTNLPPSKSPQPPTPPSSSSTSSNRVANFNSQAPLLFSTPWDATSRLDYYAYLASKLAEDGRLEDFALIAETSILSGVDASRFIALLNVELVAKGISLNFGKGKVNKVIEVLRNVEKLGIAPLKLFDRDAIESLRREIRRMLSVDKVEEIVDLMEVLAGFQFKIKELVDPFDIIKVCCIKSKPHTATRYAFLLPHTQIVLCKAIDGFGKRRDLLSALTVYEASKNNLDGPSMFIYRTIIDVCGLCGDYMKSRYIYEELGKQNITPNVYVLNSLMNVNAHDMEYILDIFKSMQKLGTAPDMSSYNILLKACCLTRRVDLAQNIYKEAKRLESEQGLKLDVFTYCTVIKVFADAKSWQMALRVKEDMQSAGVTPNTVTWSSLISACANAGFVDQATKLFDEMLQAGCEPNSQCCNSLLHACVEACQYDRAFRLFQSWKRSTVKDTFNEDNGISKNVVSSSERSQGNAASSQLNTISNSHHLTFSKQFSFAPTTTTYNILLKACGTDYYHAKALMDEMKTLGLSPDQISWSTLIDICGGSGNIDEAIQILKTMHFAGTKPDVISYTTAIKVCVDKKKLSQAFSLFEEMKRYQIRPNLVTYNTLLRARSKYGSIYEVRQCLAIYQDMRKAGYKAKDHYLKELIEEWCEEVIQNNHMNRAEIISQKRIGIQRPHSYLLEKVATHLEKGKGESLAVDLQGVGKVEARIVVLAVLRMIKENYIRGDLVKDDMVIILGRNTLGTRSSKPESDVKDAVIKLLQDELRLEVLLVSPGMSRPSKVETIPNLYPTLQETNAKNKLFIESLSSPRRPAILQRLKVTKESLHRWLREA